VQATQGGEVPAPVGAAREGVATGE